MTKNNKSQVAAASIADIDTKFRELQNICVPFVELIQECRIPGLNFLVWTKNGWVNKYVKFDDEEILEPFNVLIEFDDPGMQCGIADTSETYNEELGYENKQ